MIRPLSYDCAKAPFLDTWCVKSWFPKDPFHACDSREWFYLGLKILKKNFEKILIRIDDKEIVELNFLEKLEYENLYLILLLYNIGIEKKLRINFFKHYLVGHTNWHDWHIRHFCKSMAYVRNSWRMFDIDC